MLDMGHCLSFISIQILWIDEGLEYSESLTDFLCFNVV